MAIPTGPNEKDLLRQEAKTLLRGLERGAMLAWSDRIVKHLAAWLESKPTTGPVATFAALPGEPDLMRLHEVCPDQEWVYPLVGPGRALTLHLVRDPDTLVAGSFGIREPDPARHPAVGESSLGAILCPGLAFAHDGARLGRGKGFYDRLLGRLDGSTPRIGVAFGPQVIPLVPTAEHDQGMTCLVTESGIQMLTPPAASA